MHQLEEVIVKRYDNINAESLGIISQGQKKYTAAERKLETATALNATANDVNVRMAGDFQVEKGLQEAAGL